MLKAARKSKLAPIDLKTLLSILPVYVERDARNGKLSFCLSPGGRKRPLPSDPSTAEFSRAYHACLLDAGENNDLDDWSELRAMHEAQDAEEERRAAMSDTELAHRRLAFCSRLLLLADPKLDHMIVPLFERLECDLAMLRARDRALGPSSDCQPFDGEHGK
jgi:hypothetical protein